MLTPQTQSDDTTAKTHVFTYGSLMFADVFGEVTGQLNHSRPAILTRWRRYGLRGLTYPGAVRTDHADDCIEGVLWLDVAPAAIAKLDLFEGEQYRRVTVQVQTVDGLSHEAQIYEWLLHSQLEGAWSPERFSRDHRASFVQIHGQQCQ